VKLKQLVLGSKVGRVLGTSRDALEMFRGAFLAPESVGMIANDQLAMFLVARIARTGRKFIDVGAHLGSVTAAVLHHDPCVAVVAIEAVPEKAANLRRKFPMVEVHNCAAGDRDGETSFFVHARQSAYSSLRPPEDAGLSSIDEVRVSIRRLDSLVAPDGVDAIKVDVEGAELAVLRGGTAIISSSRPVIMFESAPQAPRQLEDDKAALWKFFSDMSYPVLVPNRVAHNDDGLTRDGFIEGHLYPRRTTNYFAIPRERRIELRDRARDLLGVRVA
jgi:FkbM family methyltransferase